MKEVVKTKTFIKKGYWGKNDEGWDHYVPRKIITEYEDEDGKKWYNTL